MNRIYIKIAIMKLIFISIKVFLFTMFIIKIFIVKIFIKNKIEGGILIKLTIAIIILGSSVLLKEKIFFIFFFNIIHANFIDKIV